MGFLTGPKEHWFPIIGRVVDIRTMFKGNQSTAIMPLSRQNAVKQNTWRKAEISKENLISNLCVYLNLIEKRITKPIVNQLTISEQRHNLPWSPFWSQLEHQDKNIKRKSSIKLEKSYHWMLHDLFREDLECWHRALVNPGIWNVCSIPHMSLRTAGQYAPEDLNPCLWGADSQSEMNIRRHLFFAILANHFVPPVRKMLNSYTKDL